MGFCSFLRKLFHVLPKKWDVQGHREIYRALIELRALTDADRAYVYRFHNGGEFLLSDPVWRVSCTHEIVRDGVTYEATNIQGILVSRIFELMEPIFSDASVPGMYRVKICEGCHCEAGCKRVHKYISVVQTEHMPPSFSRFFLESQNIKTVVWAGMASRSIFGSVGVNFTGSAVVEEGRLGEIARHVCRQAEKVRYAIEYRGPDRSNRNFVGGPGLACV